MRRARGGVPSGALAAWRALRVGFALAVWGACIASGAFAQDSLAGNYRLDSNELRAEVTTWGADCGPRPESRRDPTHPTVEVRAQGTHLAIGLPERTVRTDACWSPNPSVRVANVSASPPRWRVECLTPEGDSKREHGVYTLVASASALELSEESAYDWQLKDSHCVAKVHVAQRLTRVGTGAQDAATPPPAAPPVETPPPKPKCTPGPLARLRLRPSEAHIAPGERVCFSVRGFDAAGCPTEIDATTLHWILDKPEGASGTFARGCFKAAERAAEAEGRFQLAVSNDDQRDESTIVVSSVDLSDITARRGTRPEDLASREEEDESVASDLGIEAAVKRSFASLPLVLAALLLGFVAALVWFVHRRAQKARRAGAGAARQSRASSENPQRRASARASGATDIAARRREGANVAQNLAGGVGAGSGPSSDPPQQLICPTCRRGYAAGTTRCPNDGSVPIPYSEFLQQAQGAHGRPRTCPACGAQLAAGALFCGVCGRKLQT